MNKYYSLRIPKPCQEDWNLMTPKEKGRFCSSCEKTVIDFTVMSDHEVKEFLIQNQGKKLCGHVNTSQLDLIHVKIPVDVLNVNRLGSYSFLMVLFIVMGTTLMSCKDNHGKMQKIDRVEIVDSLFSNDQEIPVMGGVANQSVIHPPECVDSAHNKEKDENEATTDTNTVVLNQGVTVGEVVTLDGEMEIDVSSTLEISFGIVEQIPKFPNTPNKLTKTEEKNYFQKTLNEHFDSNLNFELNTGLQGILRAYTRFEINKKGKIEDIQVRAHHPMLEEETRRVIALLPDFTPGKHNGETVSVIYTLPITFNDK